MSIIQFNRKQEKKTRASRRPLTLEERIHRRAEKVLFANHPDMEIAYLAEKLKIAPPTPTNPVAKMREEMALAALKKLSLQLDTDPEMAETLGLEAWDEYGMGKGKGTRRRQSAEEGGYLPQGSLTELEDQIDAVERIKEKLGGGVDGEANSGGSFLGMDNKTIGALANAFFANLLNKGGVPGVNAVAPQRLFVVQVIDQGKVQERAVTEEQYRQLAAEGRLRPMAVLAEAPAKPEAKPLPQAGGAGANPPGKTAVGTDTQPSIAQLIAYLDADMVEKSLKQTPEAFIVELLTKVDAQDANASLLQNVLSLFPIDVIMPFLEQYRGQPQYADSLERLLSDEGKKWLTEVVGLLQSGEEDGEEE